MAPFQPDRDIPALLGRAFDGLNDGRWAEARQLCERVLRLQPKHVEALHLLGLVLCRSGESDKGLKLLRRAIAFEPRAAALHNNLGNVLRDLGRAEEALGAYDKALAVEPALAAALYNSGNALRDLDRPADAVQRYDRALALQPDYAEALVNRGNAQATLGEPDAALASFDQAIALRPDFAEAHYNRANALATMGRKADALAGYDRALALEPAYAAALNNKGIALQADGRYAEAQACYETALAANPEDGEALSSLGNLKTEQGRVEEALEIFAAAARLRPDLPGPHSNLIMTRNYRTGLAAADHLAAHRAWGAALAVPKPRPFPLRRPGRLRVGYVSADFRTHSVAYFLEPLLAHHDRAAVEVFCYADVARPDATTARLRALADHWVPIDRLSDAGAAARIRDDGIDLLIDLSGHTGQSRLSLFAARPAPVQATWLGYPATTGLAAMDWRLTDGIADPPGAAEPFHAERLLRLPNGFLCYRPPAEAGEPAPAPMIANGFVTFGSFNQLAKLSDETVAAWASVLDRVPGSRLLLKSKALDDAATRAWHLGRFQSHGIAAERLELLGYIAAADGHLAAYGRIDVALDPFPYNGTTTTCEALWMGVPVVTLAGDRHAGRVGVSLLTRIGLDTLVAHDIADYAARATALVADRDGLTALRAGLRDRLRASPLLDEPRFARDMEAAFEAMVAAPGKQP
jgi:predicted O-linked N-acetylglucosamine transferase (SPINDLY family)